MIYTRRIASRDYHDVQKKDLNKQNEDEAKKIKKISPIIVEEKNQPELIK